MMKHFFLDICLSVLVVGFISGCASVTPKEERLESVVGLQVNVLKKIVHLRQQEAVKLRINSDPVLAEQERFLLSGLDSVINSQEAYLKTKTNSENKRGSIER